MKKPKLKLTSSSLKTVVLDGKHARYVMTWENPKLKAGLEIYQELNGDWRWRFCRKGRIKYSSSEGYRNFAECKGNAGGTEYVSAATITGEFIVTPLKPAKGNPNTIFKTPKASAKWLAKVQAKGKAAK